MSNLAAEALRKPDMTLPIAHLPRPDQYKLWQQISSRIGDVEFDERTDADDTPFVSIAWNLGHMLLTDTSFPISKVTRTKRHIAMGNSDYVRLRMFRGGSGHSIVDDNDVPIVPREVHFVHGSSEVRMTAQARGIIGLLIPYELLDIDVSRVDGYFSAPAGSPTARLMGAALETTLSDMPRTLPGDVPMLASALIGMVRGLLLHSASEEEDRESFNLLQRHAIRQYVDDNLQDNELTVDRLSEVFNASRASIYRHFTDDGGLQKYVTNRRLDRCFLALLETEPKRGAVRRIAESWGFLDPSHFLKRFRERFDTPPTDILGLGRGDDGEAAAGDASAFPDFSYLLRSDLDHASILARLKEKRA